MAIISFDPEDIIDYIPEFGDNRDSENPCIVRLKFVSHARVQHYGRIIAAKIKGTTDPVKINQRTEGVQRKQFVENVESVSGYFIKGVEITDPGEVYDTADATLIFELIRAMESASKLSESQVKN
jgi:hypothetical protein